MEMDVFVKIEYELKWKGICEMLFLMMVLFGEKMGEVYGNLGFCMLKLGDMVLFDLGVVLDGYCLDIICIVVYKFINDK